MKTVNIPAKACPVVDEVDVLVVGGGAAGIGAAIGAAQCGASVALVEYFGALGGLLTNGYVTNCEAGVAISGDKILIKGVFGTLFLHHAKRGIQGDAYGRKGRRDSRLRPDPLEQVLSVRYLALRKRSADHAVGSRGIQALRR